MDHSDNINTVTTPSREIVTEQGSGTPSIVDAPGENRPVAPPRADVLAGVATPPPPPVVWPTLPRHRAVRLRQLEAGLIEPRSDAARELWTVAVGGVADRRLARAYDAWDFLTDKETSMLCRALSWGLLAATFVSADAAIGENGEPVLTFTVSFRDNQAALNAVRMVSADDIEGLLRLGLELIGGVNLRVLSDTPEYGPAKIPAGDRPTEVPLPRCEHITVLDMIAACCEYLDRSTVTLRQFYEWLGVAQPLETIFRIRVRGLLHELGGMDMIAIHAEGDDDDALVSLVDLHPVAASLRRMPGYERQAVFENNGSRQPLARVHEHYAQRLQYLAQPNP